MDSGKTRSTRHLGALQQKILLILATGATLALTYSPYKQLRIIRGIGKEWKAINQNALRRAIQRLYQSKLVEERTHTDGSITITLNKNGKEEVLRYKINELAIPKPARWDHKWRITLFDIPESQKKLRDTFRWHIKQLGFYEFQKSVFIYPYDCKKELDFIVEFYQARKYIRFIIAESIDNELHLRTHFKI